MKSLFQLNVKIVLFMKIGWVVPNVVEIVNFSIVLCRVLEYRKENCGSSSPSIKNFKKRNTYDEVIK